MTAISPLRGTQLYIKVEDDASPAAFAHPCLINAKRGIKFNADTKKQIIPDCDNPDDPAWQTAFKDALSAAIDGAGILDNKLATIQFYDGWFRSKGTKRVRVYLGTLGYWEGEFMLSNWEVSGDRGANCECSITLESHETLSAFTAE